MPGSVPGMEALALGCRGLARLASLLLLGGEGGREVGGPGGEVNSTAQVREVGRGGGVPWCRRRRRPCSPWMMPPCQRARECRGAKAGCARKGESVCGGVVCLCVKRALDLNKACLLDTVPIFFSIVFTGLRRRHHSPILAMLAP